MACWQGGAGRGGARPEERAPWATKEIAHYDPRHGQFVAGLTYADLHTAVDLVLDMAIAYRSRILGSHMPREVSMPTWEGVFRAPWIREDVWDTVIREIRVNPAPHRK